jgi:hypothetical protein
MIKFGSGNKSKQPHKSKNAELTLSYWPTGKCKEKARKSSDFFGKRRHTLSGTGTGGGEGLTFLLGGHAM